MGLIALEGIQFHGYIGCYDAEKIIGNQYLLDIYITVSDIPDSDCLPDTLDYSRIHKIVFQHLDLHANLLETGVNQVIKIIQQNFSGIDAIKVRLSKLNPPINGSVQRVYVEQEQKIL